MKEVLKEAHLVAAITPSLRTKANDMIEVPIPQDVCFDLPEGVYRARVDTLKRFTKQTSRDSQQWIRILFEVQVPGISERWIAKAGKNFKLDLNHGSELRNFLTGLLGKEYFKDHSGAQADLAQLEGVNCCIELRHVRGRNHDKPFVDVAGIRSISVANEGKEQR